MQIGLSSAFAFIIVVVQNKVIERNILFVNIIATNRENTFKQDIMCGCYRFNTQ